MSTEAGSKKQGTRKMSSVDLQVMTGSKNGGKIYAG